MKHILIVLTSLLTFVMFGQEKCGTEEYTQLIEKKYPEYKEAREKVNIETIKWIQANNIENQKTIITIPVVVHVVWNTNSENISDAQIFSQIDVLNEDFRRTNSDANNTPSHFQSVAADSEIEFCLASIDPNGTATTGITRTQTSVTSFSISNDAMKSSSSGGIDPWPQDDYLNIWVCDLGGGLLGYATPPSSWPNPDDGVVIGYRYFGTTGVVQAPYNKGRTATHEVGHWLNLDHVWGDSNCGNDNCNDTPTQQSANYGCPNGISTSNCSGNGSYGDMYMNYMDYTNDACMNLFTQDQKSRMISAINQYRSNLLNHNLCSGTPPTASWNCVNGNCVDPGTGNGTYSSYNACINSCNCIGISTPIYEDFQNGNLAVNWSIENNDNSDTWELTNTAGYNSSSSIYINNADYAANGEYDDLILPTLDFSSLSNVNLTFDYAYSLWTNPNASQIWSDTLIIFVSEDCGTTWQNVWEEAGTNLVTTTPVYNAFSWTPNSNNDWSSASVNLNNYLNQDDIVIKFRNVNQYENNLYLDNINVTSSLPSQSWDCDGGTCYDPGTGNGQYNSLASCLSNCITNNINEIGQEKIIFPNPAKDYLNVNILGKKEIYTLLGKKIFSTRNHKVNIKNLAKGIYIIKVNNQTMRFAKE